MLRDYVFVQGAEKHVLLPKVVAESSMFSVGKGWQRFKKEYMQFIEGSGDYPKQILANTKSNHRQLSLYKLTI